MKSLLLVVFSLFLLSSSPVHAQVNIVNDYAACRLYATTGIGIDPTINFHQSFSQCANVSSISALYHVGWLAGNDAQRLNKVAELKAIAPGLDLSLTFSTGSSSVPVFYCGASTTLNLTVTTSYCTATGGVSFPEISQVNDNPPFSGAVNFYTDWYRVHFERLSLFYVSTTTYTSCSVFETCINQYNVPVFYKSPDGGPVNSYFIRSADTVYEVVCGVPEGSFTGKYCGAP